MLVPEHRHTLPLTSSICSHLSAKMRSGFDVATLSCIFFFFAKFSCARLFCTVHACFHKSSDSRDVGQMFAERSSCMTLFFKLLTLFCLCSASRLRTSLAISPKKKVACAIRMTYCW